MLARNILVRGEPKLFLHFVDAGVDPAFQGLGANRATQEVMYGTFQPQFDLSIDDSNNPHMIRGRQRLGGGTEAFGNAVRPAVLPLDAMRLRATSIVTRLRAASIVTRLRARGHRGRASDVAIRVVTEFDERFDTFCAAASAPFDFIPERTRAFLNWRYADPRAGAFTIRVAERDDRLLGYVVSKSGVDATHIVDLLVAPDAPDVVTPLIEAVIDEARGADAPSVSCWLPERHPYRGALAAAGFFSLGETSVVYRSVSMPAAELAFLERSDAAMHFTYGDTDFV